MREICVQFYDYGLISANVKISAQMFTIYAQNLRAYGSSNKNFIFWLSEFLVQITTQREGFLPKTQKYFTENA